MDSAENFDAAADPIVLARKSWIVYIWPTVLYVAILYVLFTYAWSISKLITLPMIMLCFAAYFYKLLSLRSYMLYYDDNGVWVFSGVFPWSRGVSGVKWRDLDEAIYFQNFLSWMFNAYTIRVSQRQTKTAEILLDMIHMGQSAVQTINHVHHSLLAKSKNQFGG